MTSIKNAQLDWNESGNPISAQFDDVYFSNANGLEETRYVFLQQNNLPTRWEMFQQRRFVVGETGFGTGLNFLALWQQFNIFHQQYPNAPLQELHFISFEKYPLSQADLIQAHQSWPELAELAEQLQEYYPPAIAGCQRIVLADGAVTLDLWFGDIKDYIPQVPYPNDGIIDTWFLDGFAPSKNPEMWNQNLFDGMAHLAKQECRVATFTAAGFVRRGLIDAGFTMKKVKGFGIKREMIAGELTKRTPHTNQLPWFDRLNSVANESTNNNAQDIAIIGGGIASAALIQTLIRRGQSVTLYCQDSQAAQGASGNRQGAVYPLLTESSANVSKIFSAGFIFARQFINQAARQFSFAHDWCGVTQLMWDDKSEQKLTKMLANNYPEALVTTCNKEQASQYIGLPTSYSAAYYPLGGWLSPVELTSGLIQQLSCNPLFKVVYNAPVSDLTWQSENQQWLLDFKNPEIPQAQHQTVVVANGHQFDELEQTSDLPLSKVKGQVSHILTTENLQKIKSVLCYDGYLTPYDPNNNQHCIGANYDRHHIDYEFDLTAQQENANKLTQCIPDQTWPHEVDISANHSKQGVRCVSRDHLPFVGNVSRFHEIMQAYQGLQQQSIEEATPLPHQPNLFCLLGLGSRGLSSAPLMAEILASQICNDPLPLSVDLLAALHPSRMWVRRLRKGKAVNTPHKA